MSETDSFIQEVSEEVRQDRMFALWKKYAPFVIGAVILIVGAAAYWSWKQSSDQAEAEARGSLLIKVDSSKTEEVVALPEKIDGDARLIADLMAARALADAGNTDEAAAAYAGLAGRDGLSTEYRDLAVLQAVRLGAESIDADSEVARIADGDGPYRLLGKELRAARLIEAGKLEEAHAELTAILRDPDVTANLFERARVLLLATGGEDLQPETDEG